MMNTEKTERRGRPAHVFHSAFIIQHSAFPAYFFLVAAGAAPPAAPLAAAAPLAGAAPLAAVAPAAGAAPLPAAGAAAVAPAAAVGAAPSAAASFSALPAMAALRCATFGRPNTLFASVHFSSSFNLFSRSNRVSTLRCRTSALAPFKLRSSDMVV